jgi:hypothetical protein
MRQARRRQAYPIKITPGAYESISACCFAADGLARGYRCYGNNTTYYRFGSFGVW